MTKDRMTSQQQGYMKVYLNLFKTSLSMNAILLLCYLIDVEPSLQQISKNGFKRISNSFIRERFDWSPYIIKTAFNELVKEGFLTVRTSRGQDTQDGVVLKYRWFAFTDKVLYI